MSTNEKNPSSSNTSNKLTPSLRAIADAIARKRKLNKTAVLEAIQQAQQRAHETPVSDRLTDREILAFDLPDGTRALIIPDIHCPANEPPIPDDVQELVAKLKTDLASVQIDVPDVFATSRWPAMPQTAAKDPTEVRCSLGHLLYRTPTPPATSAPTQNADGVA